MDAGPDPHGELRVHIPATAYTPNRGRWAVGLYDHRTGQRLPLQTAGPARRERQPALSATWPCEPQPGEVPNPLQVDFLDNISLVGYSFSSRTLRPGDPLTVTLFGRPVDR